MKLNKVFADAEEKLLKAVVIYGKESDNYAYADDKFTMKISKKMLLNAAVKGLVVSFNGALFNPVCFKEDEDGFSEVTIWNTTAETAAAITLHSEEYTAE